MFAAFQTALGEGKVTDVRVRIKERKMDSVDEHKDDHDAVAGRATPKDVVLGVDQRKSWGLVTIIGDQTDLKLLKADQGMREHGWEYDFQPYPPLR